MLNLESHEANAKILAYIYLFLILIIINFIEGFLRLKIYLIYDRILKSLIPQICLSLFLLSFYGCGSLGDNQVAKVHQAWNARYQYDLENRRMVSSYQNQKVGRSIGRDEWGRVNYDRFWVMKPFKGENLLELHKSELDSKRDARWDEANRNLIEARKIELSQIANIEDDDGDGVDSKDDEMQTEVNDDFLPAPFLPQGIEIPSGELNPQEVDGGGLPPFDDTSPMVPMGSEPDAPSPFAPLPPL